VLIPTEIKSAAGVARAHAVVVSWEGAALLPACLSTLRDFDAVWVVDNGSTDGTLALLAKGFPWVRVIANPVNLGYGRANNLALQRALEDGAELIALINNDVELEPGWLAAMRDAAAALPPAGLFAGTLLFRAEERVNSTGLEIDGLGRARDRDFGVERDLLRRADGPVQGVSGGAALLRASMLREIGLFDPAYFAYYEDVELSLRAARAGYASHYVSAALARHRFGATFGPGSPQQRYLLGRGHLRTLALHQPPWKAAALVPLTALYRAAVKAPLELLRARPRLAWAELRAAASGSLSAAQAAAQRFYRR
jgi:GT2 family glycosyltransferase